VRCIAQVKPESRLRRRGVSLIGNIHAQKHVLPDIPILEELGREPVDDSAA
jgi:hypothetical protein